MPTWSVIINPVTCTSARKQWILFLEKHEIAHTVHITDTLHVLDMVLKALLTQGQRHFLFMGGDGTIHQGANALLRIGGPKASEIVFGVLPCGTGNDWVRSFGIAKERLAASLKTIDTAPMHVVRVTWPDGRVAYGINMVGGALDAAVVHLLKRFPIKLPSFIIYPFGLCKALMKPHTWHSKITGDEKIWSEKCLTIQAGFGKYCGGKMHVLPHADGNIPAYLIMRPKSLLSILLSTHTIYNGKITRDKKARSGHFQSMMIDHESGSPPIPIEADGEFLGYSPVTVEACYGVMRRVV